jgi:hypothetical protein
MFLAAYLIYKYGFAPNEVIAYMRLIRPGESDVASSADGVLKQSPATGMVVGPQQAFMNTMFATWIRWVRPLGPVYRASLTAYVSLIVCSGRDELPTTDYGCPV